MRRILLFFSVLFLISSAVMAQTRTVSGVVTGEKGETLPGVTIQVKGSNTATTTDIDGKYSIKVTDMQSVVLTVKYIGYAYQERAVPANERNADFKLQPVASNLNEVVVVGYGEQKKISLTGAVANIDVKKIEDLPSLNLAASLVGQSPNVSVSTPSQRPGQGTNIVIRNPTSIVTNGKTGVSPLYVIDDQIRTAADFNLLDANEIDNISILKDAEAAIYGIQGANGVVLVRTKRGKQGAPKISFSSSVGTASARQLPKMMSGIQLATWLNDYNQTRVGQSLAAAGQPNAGQVQYIDANGYRNGVVTQKETAWYTPDELDYIANNSTNYLEQAFKTAWTEREAVAISGGTDKVTYYAGTDYVIQNSNFKGVNSNKWGLRASIEAKAAKGLTASLNLSSSSYNSRSYWYKYDSTSESLDNDVTSLNVVQPWSKYFIDGNPVAVNSSLSSGGGIDNINVFLFQNSDNYTSQRSNVMNVLGKLSYDVPFVKGLNLTGTLNENYNNGWGQQYGTSFNIYTYSGTGGNNHIPGGTITNVTLRKNGDRVFINSTYARAYQLDGIINYNRSFGKHNISFLGVYEQREDYNTALRGQADNVIIGGKDNINFTTGTTSANQASSIANNGYLSYIGRLNYSYADKYFVQLSTRIDGSTDFLPGRNYGYFPAASVGWVVSNETFMKKVTWLDLLKVRASVGLLGSNNSLKYQYDESYKFGTGSSGGAVFNEAARNYGILYNLALANPYITWDHTTKTNYGLDLAFLRNRLTTSVDYYWNHGYNLLQTISSAVPATVAANLPVQNSGIVNSFGWEISAGWRDKIGKDFTYSFSPFFAWSDNKQIARDQSVGNIGTPLDLIGKSSDVGTYGYQSAGIIRTKEQADAIIAQRTAAAGGDSKVLVNGLAIKDASGIYHLGMINFVDQNGDGIIDANDQVYLNKKNDNHYSLGLNWAVNYKSLSLAVVMGMSWGGINSIGSYDRIQQSSANPITENKPVYWADHWTPSNPDAKYPNPYYLDNIKTTSDFWFVSGFQWNINTINLGYSLPQKWASKIGMSSARLYAVGYNMFSLTNPYPNGFRDVQSGIQQYPAIRTVSVGLNATF
ncbi:SusC/RagA family TonB-linked outer membrane protein [Mucilaginibacter mali]|uniref:SusC/RagA family TonB-linked outer membrane protein n=1 Tax=Mucilaginibacter mali TaxID=2740462 RepID=A0A7D4TSQ4_9SPHI|nr:SusC/RagA family TonB-linked outer membrane protein [Mucilaginibacter mali]QKJ28515.1 SusC/RagA family TonB-linked outer membrane protein [Mucilaginibacter mali]